MKFLKKIFKWLLVIFIALNLAILVTGHTYVYKAVWNTYLKGRTSPGIFEYDIFDNRKVEAGKHRPWPISTQYNKQAIPPAWLAKFREMETVSFVVIRNDSLCYEEYWDGGGENSVTNSFSVAKTIVSMLVGAAIEDGKIKSVDQPVGDFLPAFKEGNKSKITIKHLLTMSSGLGFDENYASPFGYPARAYYDSGLEELTYSYDAVEGPGKVFKYLSGNTTLLGLIISKATGKTLSAYASEKLWKPLGAKNDAFWSLDDEEGVEKAYCCFNTNARDFARLGQLYLDSGRWDGKQVIPEKYVLESIRPADLVDAEGAKNNKYGYKWWLMNHKGHEIFYARGILGQYIIVIPSERMVVVRLGSKRENRKIKDHPIDVFNYIEAALEMY